MSAVIEHCNAFRWVGQPIDHCDECGRPAWDHDFDLDGGGDPFSPPGPRPWPLHVIQGWRRSGRINEARARALRGGRVTRSRLNRRTADG